MEYQIENEFTSNPARFGWGQKGGASFDWDSVEKVGGQLGQDADARYQKYLPKGLSEAEQLIATFTIMVDNAILNSAKGLIGFFNSDEGIGKEQCFGFIIDNSTGTPKPNVYLAYDDGTKLTGTGSYSLTQGDKYVCTIRHVPEDGKAYLQIYDFLTEQLLFTEYITLDSTKTFTMQQVGMSEIETATLNVEMWMYEVLAVGEPDTIVYADLYCTPGEARSMVNLDAVQDMTDNTIAQIETVYAIPQVDSRFRSEGYAAPFKYGDDTPPLVRTITALLTAAYAARKAYVSVDPSESPVYKDLLKEVNELWKALKNGDLELLNKDGNIIERTEETSSRMLSTTEGQSELFTLDDVPDIDEVMSGRLYIGRPGT